MNEGEAQGKTGWRERGGYKILLWGDIGHCVCCPHGEIFPPPSPSPSFRWAQLVIFALSANCLWKVEMSQTQHFLTWTIFKNFNQRFIILRFRPETILTKKVSFLTVLFNILFSKEDSELLLCIRLGMVFIFRFQKTQIVIVTLQVMRFNHNAPYPASL